MCAMLTSGPLERRSPLPGQSEEGQLGGWLQQVSGRARVSCVSGSCNSANLKPLCDSNESLSHNSGPGNSTGVADVFFVLPNLEDLHWRTGDTRPASCTLCYALGVGNTKQTFMCLPEGVVSGTQPVCQLFAMFSTKH